MKVPFYMTDLRCLFGQTASISLY